VFFRFLQGVNFSQSFLEPNPGSLVLLMCILYVYYMYVYIYIYIFVNIYIYTRKNRRKSAIIMPNAIVSEKEIALALASFGLFRGSCCIQSIWGMRLAFQKLQH